MKKKYNKAIKNIQDMIVLNKKQNELMYRLLQGIVIKKHFPDGGLFALVNKKHYLRNWTLSFSECYKNTQYFCKNYRELDKKDVEGITLIIDLTTHIAVEEKIVFPFDKKVVRVTGKDGRNKRTKK